MHGKITLLKKWEYICYRREKQRVYDFKISEIIPYVTFETNILELWDSMMIFLYCISYYDIIYLLILISNTWILVIRKKHSNILISIMHFILNIFTHISSHFVSDNTSKGFTWKYYYIFIVTFKYRHVSVSKINVLLFSIRFSMYAFITFGL